MRNQQLFLKSRIFQFIGIVLVFLFSVSNAFSQALTGVKTIPGSYSSLAIAIADLNASGAGTGGVTFNVASGYTETLTTGLVVTATGTLSNPIIFQKNGGGANPVITSFTGTKLASSNDSIDVMWAFEGSDYITINGIDLKEAVANTNATTTMEVGYGFYKASATDGANNNTIQNCTVTLNRDNSTASTGPRANAAGSVAIEFMNCTRKLVGTALTITAVSGTSSNNKIYSNTIQNCNFGVSLSGFAAPSPYTLGDANNDIGGSSVLTGNTIINFGGGAAATIQCGAVYINNQWGSNISYNTINNNTGTGVNHPSTNRGIWLYASSIGASCNINNNTITISAGSTAAANNWCVDVEMAQSGANGNVININDNKFLNCKVATANTAFFTAIWLNTAATTVNTNNNYFYGFSYAGTSTTQVILSQLACGTLNILNNIIDSTVLAGTDGGGTHYNIGVTAAPSVAVNINNNTITKTILNTSGAGGKTLYGIYYTGATPSTNILDNTIDGITRNGTTGGTTIGIYQAGGTNGTSTATVKRNKVINLSISGTGATSTMYGIQVSSGTVICDSNTVFNLSCAKTSGTGSLYGVYDISTPSIENYNCNEIHDLTHNGTGTVIGMIASTSTGVRTVSYNTVFNITGTAAVTGISQTSSVPNIFNNKIYNLTTNNNAALIVSGILITSSSAGTTQIYNNLISGLFAPLSNGGTTETVRGINITSSSTSTLGVYNNTINLNATSSGAGFSTAGIYHTYSATSTVATLDLRNNIIVNTSTANGVGFTSAFKRSAATSIVNIGTASNNNLLYAGTPSAKNLLYSDGTNFDQAIAAYQTRMLPRETASISEQLNFLSTIGSSSSFLMIDPSILTEIEAGGKNIAGITKDYAGNIRAGNLGYTGTSGAPDMGAYEGNYLGNTANQMIFDSANADQQTGTFTIGSTNVKILRVRVYSEKGYNALEATSFQLSTTGTTATSDLLNAKVYYTANDATFTNPKLYGTGTPNGTFFINGSQRLATGVNYFWVTYDVAPGAVSGNYIDATVDNITLSGAQVTLINGDPIGNVQIKAPLSGNYFIGATQFPYTTLTAAANDLMALGMSAPVRLILTDGLYNTASGEIFPITFGTISGSSAINTITIVPNSGTASRIESANATATIDLNGASNIIIDGRPIGSTTFTLGNNLVIANTNAAAPAIRLINDASKNKIIYTELCANNATAASSATAGVVNIATTTKTNGNDLNIIRHCDIHQATGGVPAVGVSSIGTSTTAAMNNDSNTIDSNNIYNYFHATAATTAVYIGANNNNWKINNNHFYQEDPRTYTGTATNRVLWIIPTTGTTTSASGFEIHNNFIGGKDSTGAGVYRVAGSSTHLFNVMEISVGNGVPTSIQNNTITNINDSSANATSISFCGINMINGNVDCGTIAGNIIGSRTVNGAITFTTTSATVGGAMGIRTGGGSGNTFNITNNIVSGFDLYGNATTTSPEFFGFNISTGATVNATNNLIGDTLLPNSIQVLSGSFTSASTQRVSGIFCNPTVGVTAHTITGNTIANIVNNYTGTGTQASCTRGIYLGPTSAGLFTVSNNTVKNIYTSSRITGTGSGATLAGICATTTTASTVTITGNTIHTLVATDTTINLAVTNTGIFYSVGTTGNNELGRNFVHSLQSASNNPLRVMNGIVIGGGIATISNNMIRLGIDTFGNAIMSGHSMQGIAKTAGDAKIHFNTVYVGGNTVDMTDSRSYAFIRTGTGADNVSNNIFVNARQNNGTGGGGHYAVSLAAGSPLTMNYNLLRADTIGLFGGNGALTIQNWKAASGVDANSISSMAGLINATGDRSALNLHINPSTPTPIEAYGVALTGFGITLDFDGQTRSGLTPVDLGADAGNFIGVDIASPVISYTDLVNTPSTGDRVITATIADATGVYVTGSLQPRIYFKKMATGSYVSAQGVKVSGTSQNSTWNFTISAAAVSGLQGDDSVYYFIAAQDSAANNLGSFPAGAEGSDVNFIGVYPNAKSYKIIPVINGTFNVGITETYKSLTGVNGIFNYLNTSVLNGNITIYLTSDIEEPGTIALNEMIETGAGGYTITIRPDVALLRSLTGSLATSGSAILRLDGADRVKIDGSYNGSGKYIRVMNRVQAAATINLLNDADNDTIANCIIEGVNNTVGMLNFFGTVKVGGTGNDSNAIMGCIFKDTTGTLATSNIPNTGIFSQGTALLGNDYNTISDNEIYNFGYNGIHLSSTSGDFWTFSNNKFYQVIVKNNSPIDIMIIKGGSGHIVKNNSIGGSAPDRSGNPYNTTGAVFTAIKVEATVGTVNPITINNNTVSNMAATGTNPFAAVSVAGGNIIIKDNTLGGGIMPYDTLRSGGSAGLITCSGGTVLIQNNVLSDYRNYNTSALYHAAIYTSGGTVTIKNDTIRNIEAMTAGIIASSILSGIYLNGGSNHIVDGNTVYNIKNLNAGSLVYNVAGIHIKTSTNALVQRNRIYRIMSNGTGTGTNAPLVMGIFNSTDGHKYYNNQISLGDGASGQAIVVGIQNASATTGVSEYVGNSIFIGGAISAGTNNSYAFQRTSTGVCNATNNIFYNSRTTLGTGIQYAIGSANAITSANLNYNLMVSNDTAAIAKLGTDTIGWADLNTLYTTNYNTNWAERTTIILPEKLFKDTLVGDLGIITNNEEAWYANGKGIAKTGLSGDFNTATGVRSTSIVTGAVDIGSVEFTPTSIPPIAYADKFAVAFDSTQFFVAGRVVAKINWGVTGSLPANIDLRYYSGVNPSNTYNGSTYTNAYWNFQPTGGSGYTYDLTLMSDSASFGTVSNATNFDIAQYNGTGTSWTDFTSSTVSLNKGFVTTALTTTALGMYAGTDGSNNPLPVKLLQFTATKKAADVQLNWTSASEQNNKGFEVERSLDGKSFDKISFVKGAGNSNKITNYILTDKDAFAKGQQPTAQLYYRLKQVDMNGNYTYSNTVSVTNQTGKQTEIAISPNPFNNNYFIALNATENGTSFIQMVDIQGRLIAEKMETVFEGINKIEITHLSDLQPGIYFVKITINGETLVTKLVKQ
jgi:hypothetical protein